MSRHPASALALSSLQLSRPLSTSRNAASLSARLRKQWRGQAQVAPAATVSNSQPVPTTSTSTEGAKSTSTLSQPRRSSSQRKAALRALRANKSQNRDASLKFVQSIDKGKAKDRPDAPSSSTGAKEQKDTAQAVSMLKELNTLENLLDSLQSKAFSIAQRLKTLELAPSPRSDPLQEMWGPDRLSPPAPADSAAATEDSSSAAPSASEPTSKQNPEKRSDERKTRLLFGNDLLAEASLRWRDSKGRILSNMSYSGPFADEQKRWSESITGCVSANSVPVEKVEPLREMEIAKLAHGLDRVLFNPGVYWLRDPRSGIYNFDPRIKDILDVDLFDYAALPPYVTSSKDPELATLTKKHQKKYCGSTSSMTALLSQCYFLISGWRDPDVTGFSSAFAGLPSGFSVGAKLPASILLNWNDGHYAIDADKTAAGEAENSNYVLTSLGKSMEKMLTATPEEYAKYMRINSWKLTEEEKTKPEAYHYASTGKMMMRSQLDCHDDRLPRKTFDLKTRASIGIRNDRANYVEGSGYQIRRATGVLESFEREYFDMIRAAFLKYNFQARIGHMDGIFVAYHTTSTIFGFQYIPVEEMNERLFGSQEMADQAFKLSLGMMEAVLDAATSMFPEQTLKITIETKEKSQAGMSVYVEPASTPVTSAATDSEAETATRGQGGERSIVQLDVTVDRYLDGGLMMGPVDFSQLPGRRIDPLSEDEIERRMRASLPAVRWEIDYSISPRPELSEAQIRSHLDAVRAKQASLNSLILPNVDALNQREHYRTQQLAVNPDALHRFLQERASGVAAGMPLAPGQLSASTPRPDDVLTPTAEPEADTDAAQTGGSTPKSTRRKQAESRFVRMRNLRTLRLRELAKLGAHDAQLQQRTDQHILYHPRS